MKADDPRHGTRNGYLSGGCRLECCRRAQTRYMKLYRMGRAKKMVPAIGTQRRIQALLALGWTHREMGEHLRRSQNYTHELLHNVHVRSDVAADIERVYNELCMTVPQGWYAARNRNYARRLGYAPPLAWDDIDDPNEQPAGMSIEGGVWAERAAVRIAALEDYADQGMTLDGACAQLGITDKSLWKWCDRYDLRELYERLAARQRVVENRFTRGAVA